MSTVVLHSYSLMGAKDVLVVLKEYTVYVHVHYIFYQQC